MSAQLVLAQLGLELPKMEEVVVYDESAIIAAILEAIEKEKGYNLLTLSTDALTKIKPFLDDIPLEVKVIEDVTKAVTDQRWRDLTISYPVMIIEDATREHREFLDEKSRLHNQPVMPIVGGRNE